MTTIRYVPGTPAIPLGSLDLVAHGYRVDEFFVSGRAGSFRAVGGQPAHGRWAAVPDGTAAYATRVVVVRPESASRFDGTVVCEWLNVSGGTDVPTEWLYLHRHLLRTGAAWVGVSAQRAGISGGGLRQGPHLRATDLERYGDLEHPGDAYSYDIFTRVAAVMRSSPGELLGPLRPDRVLAVGESQAAIFLVTYLNAIDPLARVVDGVLLHGRGARGAWIDGTLWDSRRLLAEQVRRIPSLSGHRIRADVRVPVMTVQTETDLMLLGSVFARQPDGPRHRTWEIAGAAHFDTYGLSAAYVDDGTLPPAELNRLLAPVRSPRGFRTSSPVNSGPQQHYVLQAAFDHLGRWAAGGRPPPSAARLETRRLQPLRIARDEYGLARGGVRTPWVDVPLAALSGLGQAIPGFGMLFGSTRPLDSRTLGRLYPGGSAEYTDRFRAAAEVAVSAGFLLDEDLPEITALGGAAWPGALARAVGPSAQPDT